MKPFWTYGDLAFLVLLYLLVSTLILSMARGGPATLLAGQLASYGVWFGAIALLFRRRYGNPFWASFGWTIDIHWAAAAIATGPVLMLLIEGLSRVLQLPPVETPVRALLLNPETRPLAILSIAVAGPIAEEIAFRGLLQPLLTASLGVLSGIALAALPFGLLHAPQTKFAWVNVAMIAAAGAVFGWLRYRANSTLAAALAHISYNTSLLTAFFFKGNHG
jgi:membrane protease YdiL (CAAX protease family)